MAHGPSYILLMLLPISMVTLHVYANDDNLFFDMPLSELTQVTVASKRLESVNDAPSVITVITHEDIKRYGARHLRDVIDRLVNAQVIGSTAYPHNLSLIHISEPTRPY